MCHHSCCYLPHLILIIILVPGCGAYDGPVCHHCCCHHDGGLPHLHPQPCLLPLGGLLHHLHRGGVLGLSKKQNKTKNHFCFIYYNFKIFYKLFEYFFKGFVVMNSFYRKVSVALSSIFVFSPNYYTVFLLTLCRWGSWASWPSGVCTWTPSL